MISQNIIEDLLLEVSVYHPIINFQEKEQVETLIWICEQKGYTNLIPTIKQALLTETGAGEEAKKKGLVHLGRGYYGKEKGQTATHKTEDGKLIAIQATPSKEPSTPPSKDDIEGDLPPSLKPSAAVTPVQRKDSEEEERPEDKAKKDHEKAIEDPEKVLNDPQASARSKAVARNQQTAKNLAAADASSKNFDAKGEFKPDPKLEPKTDEEGNVAGTAIPAEVKENPDPKFVGWVATQLDKFGDKVLKEEERAQQTIIEQMKKEGKLPADFKAVGGREMGFGFKHPALKDKPELQKELGDRIKKENKPPHFNLCEVSIPGTNKFCDENLGIPREKMPQLGGKPKPGSQGEAKAKRIADENVRKKMGLGIDTPIPPSRQSEYDELYSKENINHVNVEQEFEDYLKSEGIAVSPPVEVPASSLKATQSELVGEQVVGMVDSLEEDPNNPFITAPIMVTKDGYVIDGHHRWAAIQTYNMKHCPPNGPKPCISMKVRIVDEDIQTHIPRANAFADRMGIETMSGKAKGSEEKTEPAASQKVSEPEEKKKDGDEFAKDSRDFKYEPKVKVDKPGAVGKSNTGKKYYSIGGGYYSDTPGGEAKYIRVESVLNLAIETDKQIWWNLLFETAINGILINEAGKNKKIKGSIIPFEDEKGEPGKLVKLPTVPIPGAPKDTEDGEKPEAPSTQPSQPEPEPIDSEETTDETEETEAESGEAVEIDLDKLSKTAKQREENLDKAEENARKKMGLPAEGEVPADKKEEFDKEVKANKKQKKNYEASKQKLFKEKISKIKDKPSGIREALRKTIFNEPLTTTEKTLLSNHVRIVEPTGAKPNALKIYVAQEPGNFNRKSKDKKTKPLSFELGAGSAEGLIRDIMGANGVQNIATSAFGGKKSTAGQMYTDESGKTATLKPQPTVKRDPQSKKIQSVTFGNTTLERLNENEPGISSEEKIRRERSNRNLDEFGKQIEEGKLKFVDTDSGIWPDTAANRASIIKDSLSKMHDKLLAMAEKAGARPGSEAMKLLDRLKKLSTLDPNQNPEAWYKEYNDLFHDIAKTEEEPKLGECWANVAEIWVTLGEMQGKGQGTEQGIMALLPESTTLETVDVIKLGKNTDAANRTIVTIDGISVKKEAGGASAMVPKLRKSNFKDLDGSDGKTFKDEITGFGAKGAGSIYGLSNTLEEAKAECGRWETYYIETAKEPGKKRKKPSISEKNCAIISKINSEAKYNKILLEQQSNYQNEMADQSRRWEESGRLPKGYTDTLLSEMKAQSKEGGMIWNALEQIKAINPIYKNLKGTEKALWEKQMLKKLQNYYLHIYISHVAYNQNIESQDFENDSVYTKTDEESGEGKIDIHKSDGIRRISFMNPTFNVGWSPSGRPSNFAAGRLVPLDATEEKGRSMGLLKKSNKPVPDKKSKTTAKKPVKPTKKKGVKEMIQSLPPHIKERIANRLKEKNGEMNSNVEKLKELVRQRVRK